MANSTAVVRPQAIFLPVGALTDVLGGTLGIDCSQCSALQVNLINTDLVNAVMQVFVLYQVAGGAWQLWPDNQAPTNFGPIAAQNGNLTVALPAAGFGFSATQVRIQCLPGGGVVGGVTVSARGIANS